MRTNEPCLVRDVPDGLIACRVDGVAQPIDAISAHAVLLRGRFCANAQLELCLYRPESGAYRHVAPQSVAAECRNGTTLLRWNDAAASAAVLRALDAYARFVEWKGECGTAAYGEFLTGYPAEAESVFFDSPEAQRRAWFSDFAPLPDAGGSEIALSLRTPQLQRLYLDTPADAFADAYLRWAGLPKSFLGAQRVRRLYVGDPHCRFLFPDGAALRLLLNKAERDGLSVTLQIAEIPKAADANALLQCAAARDTECAVNDWGMLEHAAAMPCRPRIALGTLLNRRRKDPRTQWKAGFAEHAALWSENALNDAAFRAYLAKFGVERYEFERCGYDYRIPDAPCSLHFPFYATNVSRWCPLRALCLHGDRGMQQGAASCPRYCENNLLLYPAHLRMLGRGNALLALDNRAWNGRDMRRFDRWVLNF